MSNGTGGGARPRMIVATHKPAELPHDSFYLPVQVGAAQSAVRLGVQGDDEGDNISGANASYCELTGLYWAWRNLDADGLGLSHYRRYFAGNGPGPRGSRILTEKDASAALARADMIAPRARRYLVETVDSHYRNAHVGSDLDALAASVERTGQTYGRALRQVMKSRSLRLYNMFMARRAVADEYCDWLFGVLADVHSHIDLTGRDPYQERALGYMGERLFNVWLAANPALTVESRRVVNTEGERVVLKAFSMVRRKYVSAPAS